MHFISQAFTAKYPFMSIKPTMTKTIENKIKAPKLKNYMDTMKLLQEY
jgi:hypothetical protein